MNRRRLLIAITALLCSSTALFGLYYLSLIESQSLILDMRTEGLKIRLVGWTLSLARADFNVTVTDSWSQTVAIDHIEVNGTRVDAYPEDAVIKLGETLLVHVYYPYIHGAAYKFKLLTGSEYAFYYVAKAPQPL